MEELKNEFEKQFEKFSYKNMIEDVNDEKSIDINMMYNNLKRMDLKKIV